MCHFAWFIWFFFYFCFRFLLFFIAVCLLAVSFKRGACAFGGIKGVDSSVSMACHVDW